MEEVEIWKSLDFLGYPDYEVSNMGQVKSLNYLRTGKERILKQSKTKKGYLQISLYQNAKQKKIRIHRLVALAFLKNDNPIEKTEINHLDENKENNHVSNLCWCSHIENVNYGTRNERVSQTMTGKHIGEKHPMFGKHHSEETKQKMSETMKGKPQYKRRKPIQQYTKDMTFIKDWDSTKSASLELNIDSGFITACVRENINPLTGLFGSIRNNLF